MGNFYLSYGISALALLLLAGSVGRQAKCAALKGKRSSLGILIDNRERYSLNRLQLVMWSLLILSTFLAVLAHNLRSDPAVALKIPDQLLGLMGISVGSAVVASAVKDNKDATRPETISGGNGFFERCRARVPVDNDAELKVTPQKLSLVQVFLEEEGIEEENRVISVTKFQNFVLTLALWIVYIVLVMKRQGYPDLDNNVLWLMGISHAGYIGGKLPNKGYVGGKLPNKD